MNEKVFLLTILKQIHNNDPLNNLFECEYLPLTYWK